MKLKSFRTRESMVLATPSPRFEPGSSEAQMKLKPFGTRENMVFETHCRVLSLAHERLKPSSNRFAQTPVVFFENLSLREFGFLKFFKELNRAQISPMVAPCQAPRPRLRILVQPSFQTLPCGHKYAEGPSEPLVTFEMAPGESWNSEASPTKMKLNSKLSVSERLEISFIFDLFVFPRL